MTKEVPPTPQEWRKLHAAAKQVKALAPWEWMVETDLFVVEDPETGEPGFISVMGMLGEHQAIALYRGVAGLDGFWEMQDRGPTFIPEMLLTIPQVQVSWEDRDMLTDKDRKTFKSLGLRFRGRGAWPMFRAIHPGHFPWYLTGEEARVLATALEQVVEVVPRTRENTTLLFSEDQEEEEYLVRYHDGEEWQERYDAFPPLEPPAPAPLLSELLRKRVARLPQQEGSSFQIEVVPLPGGVQEQRDARPMLAFSLFIIDAASGMIVGNDILTPEPSIEAMWNRVPESVLEVMEKMSFRPQEIQVQSEQLALLLEPVLAQVGVSLMEVEQLDAINEVMSLLSHMMGSDAFEDLLDDDGFLESLLEMDDDE